MTDQYNPNPVVGRREFSTTGAVASAIAAVLLQATTSTKATAESPLSQQQRRQDEGLGGGESWMARVSEDRLVAAMKQLQDEAARAVSLVTPSLQSEYQQNGVVVIRNVVSKAWVDALREGCELAQDEPGPYSEYLHKPSDEGIFFTDLELARRLPLFSAFAQYGPCAAVAGAVMGSTSVRYLYDQLFVKERGVSTKTPWHQDGGYWRIKGPQIGSVFVPLDPVPASENLAFVRNSQHWELHNPQHFADGTQYVGTSLPPMPDINQMVKNRKSQLVMFDLVPGDVVFFSAHTVHGGPGNWGRALSTRWTGDGGAFWARPGEGAIPTGDVNLVNGELLAHNSAAFPEVWNSRSLEVS